MGVGCHVLPQELFQTQGSNLRLMSPAWAGGLFTTSATWEALASAGVLYWEGSQETDVSGVGLQTCVLKFHRAPIYLVVFTLQLSPSVLLGT